VADFESYQRARRFRSGLTPPEARLWTALKRQALRGHRFRRQHPIGPYILDFYCAAAKLAIEVDGQTHLDPDRSQHDQNRTTWLAGKGIRVVRIAAVDVRDHLDGVMTFLGKVVDERSSAVSPPPSRR